MLTTLTALALASGASLLLLASATDDGLPGLLGASSGQTHVVAHDGTGDFKTILAAIGAAEDGDTIVLRPGRYPEWVVITDRDLTIAGDGADGEVIVESGYDNTFTVSGSDLTLSDLTITGQEYVAPQ